MNRFAKAIFVVLLMCVPCCAQYDTADVIGTITDSSGAAIPGATITIRNAATGITTTATSTDTGGYTIVNVKAGSYKVTVDKAGFSQAVASNIVIEVGARKRVDMSLQPGSVTQTVEVTTAAAAIETDSSSRGEVIQTQQVVELPLNGRNASDLALLTTGVIRAPQSTAGVREGSFNVNGLRSVYSNYLLDGVDNNAYGTSNNGASNQAVQVSPDAILEFKVDANNYSAEFGRGGAATTNVVMKSGTNSIHGTGYEFLRNTTLNAIGYFLPAKNAAGVSVKPPLHQNQFGLTVGGPIIKDKIFFFGDYEGFRVKSGALVFSSIPSAAEQGVNLPGPELTVAVKNPVTGITYPANTPIPKSAISQYALKILSQFPAPVTAGNVANNYQTVAITDQNVDKYDAKLDAQFRSNMSATLRISQRKLNQFTNPSVPGPNFNMGNHTRVLDQQALLGFVWTANASTVLDARFAVTRINAGGGPAIVGQAGAETYGIGGLPTKAIVLGGYNVGDGGLPSMALAPPFTALGRGTATPQFQNPLDFDSKVSLTKIKGKHTLKVGGEWMVLREQVLDINPFYGKFSFLGNYSGQTNARENSLADFMFGLTSQEVLSNATIPNQRKHYYYFYGQDDYRLAPKLTVNVGLRWEYGSPWYERDNKMANFDPGSAALGNPSPFIYAHNGSVYSRGLVNPQMGDFGPRIGFAWSALPKTVVHGGYSISYVHDHRVGSTEELGIFGPFGPVWTYNEPNPTAGNSNNTVGGYINAQFGFPAKVSDPVTGPASASSFNAINSNITYIPADVKDTYVQSWLFNVQRELPWGMVWEIGYVGNHSLDDPIMTDYNQAYGQPTPTSSVSLQARRPYQSVGAVTCYCPNGFSIYHGLQSSLVKKSSQGLTFVEAFTYSHNIDNADQSLDFSNGNQASPQNFRDMRSERSTSNYDRKFVNVLSAVADVPVGRGRHFLSKEPAIVDAAVGGWQLDAIVTNESGLPINLRAWTGLNVPTAYQTVGNLNDWRGGESYRANCSYGGGSFYNPAGGRLGVQGVNYFNTGTIFKLDAPGQPGPSQVGGNCGRNGLRAPGLEQLDASLHKSFALPREGMSIVFRAEYFNILNKTNFQAPNPDVESSAFGAITAILPPRIGQFALKVVW